MSQEIPVQNVEKSFSPALRASDADRDRVTELLRAAVADGRLDLAEFDERLDAALSARTIDALAPLVTDLIPVPGGLGGPQCGPSRPPACSPSRSGTVRCAVTAAGRCRAGWRCAPRGARCCWT
ncbi:unnamed protein product [[Actinomadura] parvosata subsp. kistnae]|uniref:DUF1707 SHOCT-like domain-containing protein n=1 Tax=[Actinomadura] parvosata TaxID=1955412 RepID=UPI000D2BED2D|nr:unnamed protein product [Actinomadura parvosata subsp. kistnae]